MQFIIVCIYCSFDDNTTFLIAGIVHDNHIVENEVCDKINNVNLPNDTVSQDGNKHLRTGMEQNCINDAVHSDQNSVKPPNQLVTEDDSESNDTKRFSFISDGTSCNGDLASPDSLSSAIPGDEDASKCDGDIGSVETTDGVVVNGDETGLV